MAKEIKMASNEHNGDGKEGTLLLTGANSSLGLPSVEELLDKYSSYNLILTVRNNSDQDPNTNKLREILARYPSAKATIEALDLSSLANVRAFAEDVAKRVSLGKIPPISTIVCNAFAWSLVDIRHSADDYELGFQVSHLSHFLLVLKLLDSIHKSAGRIVMLGSISHDSANNNAINSLGPKIPEDLEEVVRPTLDKPGEEMKCGFRRYGNSKLANVMFMHSLNKKLLNDGSLKEITAVAINPGGFPTSRAFRDAPFGFRSAMNIAAFVLPVVRHFTSAIKTTDAGAVDLVAVAVGPEAKDRRGYFVGQKSVTSSKDSRNEELREKVWKACERWAKLEQAETVLKLENGGY